MVLWRRGIQRFRKMFLRIMAKKGKKTAYVAVARKLLTVIWHLLVNGEKYVEEGFEKMTMFLRLLVVVMFLWRKWLRF